MNLLTLLTSPLEKSLAVAVAALLLLSGSEALVIKYEMNSKTQCVSAVMATNAETKTVTTAIRNVDNATNQTLQRSVGSSITADLAKLHYGESKPASLSLSPVPSSPGSTPPEVGDTYVYTTDSTGANTCVVAVDIANGWNDWYDQTQLNWNNIENVKPNPESSVVPSQ